VEEEMMMMITLKGKDLCYLEGQVIARWLEKERDRKTDREKSTKVGKRGGKEGSRAKTKRREDNTKIKF